MNRFLTFTAGLAAGFGVGGACVILTDFPHAEAASPEVGVPLMKSAQPKPAIQPELPAHRCAPGFRYSLAAAGRYTCNRVATVACPDGTTPVNLQLHRSGNASDESRLLYECRMSGSETVRPNCARGYMPANLELYRSGAVRGGSRLMYECVRYRPGN